MRLSSGSTKGEVCARRDEESMRPNTTSLHALRYYRVALSLGLNRSKLWVKPLLPLERALPFLRMATLFCAGQRPTAKVCGTMILRSTAARCGALRLRPTRRAASGAWWHLILDLELRTDFR